MKKPATIFFQAMVIVPVAALLLGARSLPAASRDGETALLQHVVSDSVAAIQLSQLAQNRSQNEHVRALAARTIAAQTGIIRAAEHAALVASLPQPDLAPSEKGVSDYAQTISYHGHSFDQQYVLTNIGEQQASIAYLNASSESVQTPAVARFISATTAQCAHHKAVAVTTQRSVNATDI